MKVRRCGITAARVGVARLHRHNRPPVGGYYGLEVVVDGWPRGWAVVGRPVSRELQAAGWAEVTRVATDGTANACSALYGAAARWARSLSIPLVTYTLQSEPGTSLRAAGWQQAWVVPARPSHRTWSCTTRPRRPGTVDCTGKIAWVPGWLDVSSVAR